MSMMLTQLRELELKVEGGGVGSEHKRARALPLAMCLSVILWCLGGCVSVKKDWALVGSGGLGRVEVAVLHEQGREHVAALLSSTQDDRRRNQYAFLLGKWEASYCQMMVFERDGGKWIRMQFFPKSLATRQGFQGWRSRPLLIGGGGEDFWVIEYDPTQRRFSRPVVHESI